MKKYLLLLLVSTLFYFPTFGQILLENYLELLPAELIKEQNISKLTYKRSFGNIIEEVSFRTDGQVKQKIVFHINKPDTTFLTYEYSEDGKIKTITGTRKQKIITQYLFNYKNGKLNAKTSMIDSKKEVANYQYDEAGKLIEINTIDQRTGDQKIRTFDTQERLINEKLVRGSAHSASRFEYLEDKVIILHTTNERNPVKTEITYNEKGFPITVGDPDKDISNQTHYLYDQQGLIKTIKSNEKVRSSFHYTYH